MSKWDNEDFQEGLILLIVGIVCIILLVVLFIINKEALEGTVLAFVIILGIAGPLAIIGGTYLMITSEGNQSLLQQEIETRIPKYAKGDFGVIKNN